MEAIALFLIVVSLCLIQFELHEINNNLRKRK